MKKISLIILVLFFLFSCDDFLEIYPKTNISPESFWLTESDLQMGLNQLYTHLETSYTEDNKTIDGFGPLPNNISSGSFQPSNIDGIWINAYKGIRICNDFLENYETAEVSEEIKNRYAGEAKFFRAYMYHKLVKRFGDVPMITETIDMESELLYGSRTPKNQIIDLMIADLQFAGKHCPLASKIPANERGRISSGAANTFLSRIALYYGTLEKYSGKGDGKNLLKIAVESAKKVIDSKEYYLAPDYRKLFLLEGVDGPEQILCRRYAEGAGANARCRAIMVDAATTPTKYLADAFLCVDGLPIEKSPLFEGYDKLGQEFINRDPRMRLTIWSPNDLYKGILFVPDLVNQTKTGYMFKKYAFEDALINANPMLHEIVIRYAETLLNYAEAYFEMHNGITDDYLNISINVLRQRAGMPYLTNQFVQENNLNMLNEIRRERRIELCSERFRYDDIIRWRTAEQELKNPILGTKFDAEKYPNLTIGKDVILNDEGFIVAQSEKTRTFENPKHYLFPLPLRELNLNQKLVQNQGW